MDKIEAVIEVKEPEKKEEVITRYKLFIRNSNGKTRGELNRNVLHIAAKDYCDLLQTVSSFKWMTMEDIVEAVWHWELKNSRIKYNRSRKAIEEGVKYLVDATVIQEKSE